MSKTAKAFDLTIVPDPRPEAGSYYRSDHFSLSPRRHSRLFRRRTGRSSKATTDAWGEAKLKDFVANDYHNFTDNYHPDWDFAGNAKLDPLRHGSRLARHQPTKPITWNKGDEFEAARLASQKAVTRISTNPRDRLVRRASNSWSKENNDDKQIRTFWTPRKAMNSSLPTDLPRKGAAQVADELRPLLADVFALYLKTKNFHWHMSGPHFRDYHLLLDEQADQIFAISDDIAERARKIGETTLHSISEISKYQRLKDNSEPFVSPKLMLAELHQDNLQLVEYMRNTHADHLRRQRRRHHQPARKLDRRSRAPRLVPLRNPPRPSNLTLSQP